MRRKVLRFERFLVWIFEMKAGERKVLKPLEVTRGLTTHGPQTINPISVFAKGSFQTVRDGYPPVHHPAGTGGARFLEANSMLGHAIVCLEDGEYHCITPRDETPRFWERDVFGLEAGDAVFLQPGQFLYTVSPPAMHVNTGEEVFAVFIDEDTTVAIMWLKNEPEIQA